MLYEVKIKLEASNPREARINAAMVLSDARVDEVSIIKEVDDKEKV